MYLWCSCSPTTPCHLTACISPGKMVKGCISPMLMLPSWQTNQESQSSLHSSSFIQLIHALKPCCIVRFHRTTYLEYIYKRVWRKASQDINGHPGIKFDIYFEQLYTMHPSQHECFYLRLLLHETRGGGNIFPGPKISWSTCLYSIQRNLLSTMSLGRRLTVECSVGRSCCITLLAC